MITTPPNNNLAVAENYYKHMLEKDFEKMAACLHSDIQFISPLSKMNNKEDIVESAKNLRNILLDIHIRSKFCSDNQVMFAYDFSFPKPIGKLRSAALIDFKDSLISKIELFFDAKPFDK